MSDDAISDEPPQTPRDYDYVPAKKGADDGRIVVTLHYKMSKDARTAFAHPNLDAVDCLRQLVADYERGEVSMAHLVASACGIDVSASK